MKFLLISITVLSFACSNPTELKQYSSTDSTTIAAEYMAKEDSLKMENAKLAPVKITSSELKGEEIHIHYKNVGTKPVAAIRITWQLANIFGETYVKTTGEDVRYVKPGSEAMGRWLAPDKAKKILTVLVSEIVFTDGTKWGSKE